MILRHMSHVALLNLAKRPTTLSLATRRKVLAELQIRAKHNSGLRAALLEVL